MRAVIFALAMLTTVPVAWPGGQEQPKSPHAKPTEESAVRKDIVQKEQLWAAAINSSDQKTVSDLLEDGFEYSGSAQSDFDAMVFPMRERKSRRQYLDAITNAGVVITVSKQIRVSFSHPSEATARFKLEVHLAASSDGRSYADPRGSPYRGSPKILPGTYEITDIWTDGSQGWKARRRSSIHLLGGGIIPVR